MAYILNETSIKVNWTMSSQTNGYPIVINSTIRIGTNKILSTTEDEVIMRSVCTHIKIFLQLIVHKHC